MDPTRPLCPPLACPASGHSGQGNMRIHARKAQRFRCPACHKTCSATTGAAVYRLRTAAETVTLVVTVRAHGCPPHAIVAACGVDERPVARWRARRGGQGQAVQAHRVEPPHALGQVQAEDIRGTHQGGSVWMALAMRGSTRLGWAGAGSAQRDMPLIRRRSERVRAWARPRPLWCCPAGLGSSIRAMRETWRDPVRTGAHGRPRRRPWRNGGMAQVVQRDAQRPVVDVARRLGEGTPARVETRRRRAQGGGVITTASSARLTATCRARLASLTRRGRAVARHTRTLQQGMSRMGAVSNFCTPHTTVAQARRGTPPARAAGRTAQGWTVRALLALHVPPPRWTPPVRRGRRARALPRVMIRWCL